MTRNPLRFESTDRFRAGLLLIAVSGGGSSYCSIYDESLLSPGSGGAVGSGGAFSAISGGLPNTGGSAMGGAAGIAMGGSAGVSGAAGAAMDSSAGMASGGAAMGGSAGMASGAGMDAAAGAAIDGSADMGGAAGAVIGGSAGMVSGGTAGASMGGSGGAAPCGTNQKRCNGACVPQMPVNGCSSTACTACPPAPAFGLSTCNPMGACAFDCLPGYTISGSTCVPSMGTGGSGGTDDGGTVRCGSTSCVPCTPPHITCCERTTGMSCLCAPPDYVSTLCR